MSPFNPAVILSEAKDHNDCRSVISLGAMKVPSATLGRAFAPGTWKVGHVDRQISDMHVKATHHSSPGARAPVWSLM